MILKRKPSWFGDAAAGGGGGGAGGGGESGGGGGGRLSVPFHAQKCRVVKHVSYYVIEEDDETRDGEEEEEEDKCELEKENRPTTDESAARKIVETRGFPFLRVFRRSPQLGFARKSWLLDCIDRFEIVDAKDFEEEEKEKEEEEDVGTSGRLTLLMAREDPLEALRRRQGTRMSRSKGDGTEYLMAL